MSYSTDTAVSITARMLVATDGKRDADGAVRVGRALAERDGTLVDIVSVVEPYPVSIGGDGVPLPDPHSLFELMQHTRAAVLLEQRDRTHPGIHEWPFEIDAGPRADCLIANARTRGASLILMGLGSHGLTARLMQRETALQVLRASPIPVLALPRDAWGVPHATLVAIDFTVSSERAAAAAIELLGGEGTLYVAHVLPRTTIPHAEAPAWDGNGDAVTPKLEALIRRLAPPPGVQVEYALLHGDPASEILGFADEMRVDLIAAGAHGRSTLERVLLGSVSTQLVRAAACWVLVAPADSTPSALSDADGEPNDGGRAPGR